MSDEELLKENKMLKTLLGLAGLPEKDHTKRILMHDLYALNAMVINFINKSSALGIDLLDLKISDQSTADLFVSTRNVPLLPLFSIKPKFLTGVIELCQEEELFSTITLEHMRIYW